MALPIHVAAVQYSSHRTYRAGNHDKALHLLDDAGHTSDLVVLPETSFSSHWTIGDIESIAEPDLGTVTAIVSHIAVVRGSFVCYGIIERDGDRFYNTAMLVGADGRVLGKQRKVRLSDDEVRVGLSPGDEVHVFGTHLGNIGILVRDDARDEDIVSSLRRNGARLILSPSVVTLTDPSQPPEDVIREWESVLKWAASNTHSHVVWANKISGGDVLAVGNSLILDSNGSVLARGSADQEEVVRAAITLIPGVPFERKSAA